MKKTLLLLAAAVAMTGSVLAQGTITFSNFGVEITTFNGQPAGDGNYSVSLYLSGNDTPLATTSFLAGTGFISAPSEDVVVPGHAVNSTDSVFVVRAYEAGKTFATSTFRGESTTFTAGPLGGPNGANPPTISPAIDNLQTFVITPEPSTIALAAVGVGALLLRRRK